MSGQSLYSKSMISEVLMGILRREAGDATFVSGLETFRVLSPLASHLVSSTTRTWIFIDFVQNNIKIHALSKT